MITTFANYLLVNRGLSKNTVKAYSEALRDFARFINDNHPGTHWSEIRKSHCDEYVVLLVSEEAAPATIKQHISALRTFFKTCMALGHLSDNPARFVSTPRLESQLPKTIELEAISQALQSPTVTKEAKAVIAIIFETGLRLQELLDLRASDIDAATSSIKVHGKGRKERTVYYGDLTRQYGRCWHGEKFSQRQVRHMVFEALRPYSCAKHLSPHCLRHTYAAQLINNGASIEAISQLLGHEKIETTQIYARLSSSVLRNVYDDYRPAL